MRKKSLIVELNGVGQEDVASVIRMIRGVLSVTTGDADSRGAGLYDLPLADAEWNLIQNAIEECGQNRQKAAKRLGIGERTLYRKISQHKE